MSTKSVESIEIGYFRLYKIKFISEHFQSYRAQSTLAQNADCSGNNHYTSVLISFEKTVHIASGMSIVNIVNALSISLSLAIKKNAAK